MAEKKGFDLGAYLAEAGIGPNSGTGREQIEYIALDLIDDDKENFYETKGIEELSANIALFGMMDPLRIREDPENPGRYKVTSGHRRRLALKALQKDDPEKYAEATCIIDQVMQSPALQELKLIFANKDNRKYSPADLSEEAVRVEKLLYQLKEEGYEFPGRMRDHVAQAVNASKSKLSRLKVIRENLHDCWKDAYKSGALRESPAYDMARIKPQYQALLFDAYKQKPSAVGNLALSYLESQLDEIAALRCTSENQSQSCENVERMMKKSIRTDRGWERCSGCCLKCSNLKSCKYSCSKAEKKKQRIKKSENDAKKKAADEETSRIEKHCSEMRVLYFRLGEALKAAGISVKDFSDRVRTRYNAVALESYTDGKGIEGHVYPPYGGIYEVKSLLKAAEVLGCSIDWLLGRDVPGPGDVPKLGPTLEDYGPWAVGDDEIPNELGDYIVLAKWSEHGKMKPHIFAWDGSKWLYSNMDAAAAGAIVCYWIPMPEE